MYRSSEILQKPVFNPTRATSRQHDKSSFFSPFIQPKLSINQPNDVYEQEADAVAEKVMRMPIQNNEQPFFQPKPTMTPIQRKCAACEQEEKLQRKEEDDEEPIQLKPLKDFSIQKKCAHCEEEEKLQMKETSAAVGGMAVPSIVNNVIRSAGQPLDIETRSFMESRFGHDFSNVEIHNDSLAYQSSADINALAYTHGNHVVFGSGQYQPNTDSGKKLLAHELTHVVQQRKNNGSGLQRQAIPAYRDCTNGITGIADSNARLEEARLRAREFVGAAIRFLANAPAAGSVYATALNRHFITPTAADRATIAATYQQILNTLVVRNYICNSDNICEGEQAFHIAADDLVHVCRPYWALNKTCQAIILIHEGSHDIGIGIGAAHPPNRGTANYPAGNVAPPGGQTTAARMNNPDAYAFFAAHIWRSTDTGLTCF